MSASGNIFDAIFQYNIEDDALDLFFKSAWNNYQYNQKERTGEPYITGNPINSRSKLGKKRLAELCTDVVDVEFIEL